MVCLKILRTLFNCSESDVIFKCKQMGKIEQPHLTACCSVALLEDSKRKQGLNTVSCLWYSRSIFYVHEWTDHTLNRTYDGSFHCIFYMLQILHLRSFELIDRWHFLFPFYIQDMTKWILLSKSSHLLPANPGWRLRSHGLARARFKDDILSRPSSAVSLGECRRCLGQLSPVSIRDVRCVHRNDTFLVLLFFFSVLSYTLPPISILLWLKMIKLSRGMKMNSFIDIK